MYVHERILYSNNNDSNNDYNHSRASATLMVFYLTSYQSNVLTVAKTKYILFNYYYDRSTSQYNISTCVKQNHIDLYSSITSACLCVLQCTHSEYKDRTPQCTQIFKNECKELQVHKFFRRVHVLTVSRS